MTIFPGAHLLQLIFLRHYQPIQPVVELNKEGYDGRKGTEARYQVIAHQIYPVCFRHYFFPFNGAINIRCKATCCKTNLFFFAQFFPELVN